MSSTRMRPIESLPDGYSLYRDYSSSQYPRLPAVVALLATGMFFASAWGFKFWFFFTRPWVDPTSFGFRPGASMIMISLELLGLFLLVGVLHELIHGVFAWLCTRERPKFAFSGAASMTRDGAVETASHNMKAPAGLQSQPARASTS
jgi:hypothetical protein